MIIDAHCEQYRADNRAMKSVFESAAQGRAFTAEWREDEAGTFGVADCIMPHARAADLVVASQTDPDWPGSASLDVPDRLAIESGRPALIIPNGGVHDRPYSKVLIAWNARREAARAAFDALPLLKCAKDVRVVWVNPQSERENVQDIPAADICVALARHGVNCQATEEIAPQAGVGETLLACAKDFDADLLVMGCYGHTRLREFVFGGASRDVLRRMSLPVLMSH
jgi:nucleotide-binding universal stress UspA family protein